MDIDANLNRIGWYMDNADGRRHEVAQKAPNAWEPHDMSGNVMEWCWNQYGSFVTGPVNSPVGLASSTKRIARDGNRHDSAQDWSSARRSCYGPEERRTSHGFRVARLMR